jgi:GH3 auxin-responsive promoter
MKLLSPAISRLVRMRWWKIDNWINQPHQCQHAVWQNLLAEAQYTEFGRKYNFTNLQSVAQFQQAVPLSQYDDLKPYIMRMMEGEDNVLWNTPVEWFAKSSGTTSDKSKFIPVSYESLEENHYRASKDVLSFYYSHNPYSDLLTGKGLVIGGSHEVHQHNENVQYGDLSAVVLQNGPFWTHWLRTPGLDVALMSEWESKIEKMAETTIKENVTSIAGVPTWTLVLLRRILEKTGKANIKEVWPNLELYMHGGVSFVPYREQFTKIIGAPIHYLEMYNASEGFFAAQNSLDEEGMILFVNHGIFYEFIPFEELDAEHPRALQLHEVEINRNYALVISTNGGLWRYLVGDTVQFTSLRPYRVKVSGRTRHFINAFGEELMVDNTDLALSVASEKTGAVINDYTAAPVYFTHGKNGAHEWLIEFEKEPDNLSEFAFELDCALQNINSDYEAKRHRNIALRQPLIQVMQKGVFNQWLKTKGKLGGQHKVPRLSNNRNILEEIMAISRIQHA